MDAFQSDDWRPVVASYLAGKSFTTLTRVAQDVLGRGYHEMAPRDWRKLATAMFTAGWRDHRSNGATT